MSANTTEIGRRASQLVVVSRARGLTVIPESTPLTRLNYFDGKFLRASDLSAEQTYLRKLVQLSNQANGWGVAHGFSVRLGTGDTLRVTPGLAITPEGHVLLLPAEAVLPIDKLIEASRLQARLTLSAAAAGTAAFGDCVEAGAAPPDSIVSAGSLYLITAAPAEALCGEEDVFGKLCEEACATSKDRPYRVEGVVFRATPLLLQTPLPESAAVALGAKHLRSRVASAYFEDERKRVASLISGDGLNSELWCMGADGVSGVEVPIAVLSRGGSTTLFLDAWIARRELIDSPARRYWQWRMAMRPWDVFLAQVLQFQCQLRDAVAGGPPDEDDPCARNTKLVVAAASRMAEVAEFYAAATRRLATLRLDPGEQPIAIAGGLTAIEDLRNKLALASDAAFLPGNRVLIDSGIVTLPSAGYLPVIPGANTTVNAQVKRLMGPGVNLRFCVVRPDFVAHALEEAQHMERISLLEGLESAEKKPDVDVLVPNGVIAGEQPPAGNAFRASLLLGGEERSPDGNRVTVRTEFTGAGRVDASEAGAVELHVAAESVKLPPSSGFETHLSFDARAGAETAAAAAPLGASVWISGTCHDNPFAPGARNTSAVQLRFVLTPRGKIPGLDFVDILLSGTFYHGPASTIGATRIVRGTFSGSYSSQIGTGERRGGAFSMIADARLTAGGTDPLAQPPRLRFSLRDTSDEDVGLTLEFAWKGAPLQISVKALTPDIGNMDLIQSPGVLEPNDQANRLAHRAIEEIMRVLKQPQFQEQALANLFPAPPAPVDEAIVLATLDWVLFHRRRSKRCEVDRPRPEAPPRSYQAYHLPLQANPDLSLTRLIEALRRNDSDILQQLPFRPVSLVEYAPLSANLRSQPAAILADWNGLDPKPGPRLVYTAVASKEEAEQEGNALAVARLEALVKVLEPSSKPEPNTLNDVLDRPPDALPAGPDGVMVLISAGSDTVCNSIFRTPNLDVFKIVEVLIREGQIGQAMQSLTPIQTVRFDRETGKPDESSFAGLPNAWQQAGNGDIAAIAVIFREGDTTSSPDRLKEQGSEIARTIRPGATANVDVIASPAALPIDCPAMTIIAPPTIILVRNAPFEFTASADPNAITPARRQVVGEAFLRGRGGDPDQEARVNVQVLLNVPIDNPASQPPRLVIDDAAEEIEGRNMFLGTTVAGNTSARVFSGVPLKFPGEGERVFRIRNLSCNATSLRDATGAAAQVTLQFTITGADVGIVNPTQTVAVVRQG